MSTEMSLTDGQTEIVAVPEAWDDLTIKQRLFVVFYLGDSLFNATDAARRAGYQHPNVMGPRNLTRPAIKARIDARLDEAGLTANEVLAGLADHACGDIADVRHLVGMTDPAAIDLELQRLQALGVSRRIKKLVPTKHGLSVELYDAQAALALLGRVHGLFDDRITVEHLDLESLSLDQLRALRDGREVPGLMSPGQDDQKT